MLRDRVSYDEGYRAVKARRGICNPNAGFSSQLVLWGRRIGLCGQKHVNRPRAFCVQKYFSEVDSAGLVCVLVDESRHLMDAGKVYLIDCTGGVFVWVGGSASHMDAAVAVARQEARKLSEYEGASADCALVTQGSEPEVLQGALRDLCFSFHEEPRIMQVEAARPEGQQVAAPKDQETEGRSQAPVFPQGGASCAVATPRGERPIIPSIGITQLKAPVSLSLPKADAQPQQAGWHEVCCRCMNPKRCGVFCLSTHFWYVF